MIVIALIVIARATEAGARRPEVSCAIDALAYTSDSDQAVRLEASFLAPARCMGQRGGDGSRTRGTGGGEGGLRCR